MGECGVSIPFGISLSLAISGGMETQPFSLVRSRSSTNEGRQGDCARIIYCKPMKICGHKFSGLRTVRAKTCSSVCVPCTGTYCTVTY